MLSRKYLLDLYPRCAGRPIKIRFSKNAKPRDAMARLRSAERNGIITIRPQDETLVMAIQLSDDFSYDANRTWEVHVRRKGNIESLVHLGEVLDSIELCEEHELSKLQTGRVKKFEEAARVIESTWITSELREEIVSWGMELVFSHREQNGFHMLRIVLMYDHSAICVFELDGWSGYMQVNGRWADDQCATAQLLRSSIQDAMATYLESATG